MQDFRKKGLGQKKRIYECYLCILQLRGNPSLKFKHIFSVFILILVLGLLSGCSERPFLSKNGIYTIVQVTPEGNIQRSPIELSWNSNYAVLQQLLLEASLVLGDLHSLPEPDLNATTEESFKQEGTEPESSTLEGSTHESSEQEFTKENTAVQVSLEPKTAEQEKEPPEPGAANDSGTGETIFLEAFFADGKDFTLTIDGEPQRVEIKYILIEVLGDSPGRVIINNELYCQGIPNPNLETAFLEFVKMQSNVKMQYYPEMQANREIL